MTLSFQHDLYSVSVNQQVRYLG